MCSHAVGTLGGFLQHRSAMLHQCQTTLLQVSLFVSRAAAQVEAAAEEPCIPKQVWQEDRRGGASRAVRLTLARYTALHMTWTWLGLQRAET
jgi:hypothetical protein